jgi:hypothetical protein
MFVMRLAHDARTLVALHGRRAVRSISTSSASSTTSTASDTSRARRGCSA